MNISTCCNIGILNKGAFNILSCCNHTFTRSHNAASNFYGTARVKLSTFNTANNPNVTCCINLKPCKHITTNNYCSDEIDISNPIVDITLNLEYREDINFILICQ